MIESIYRKGRCFSFNQEIVFENQGIKKGSKKSHKKKFAVINCKKVKAKYIPYHKPWSKPAYQIDMNNNLYEFSYENIVKLINDYIDNYKY